MSAIIRDLARVARLCNRYAGAAMSHVVLKRIVVAGIIALSVGYYIPRLPDQFLDFRAFYCAGQAELAHADPYLEHPLHECERSVAAPGVLPMRNNVTLPAPFPGFVLAIFGALALLPYPWALLLWMSGACAALAYSVSLVARTTDTSRTANAIVLGFPAMLVALPLAQVTPFILLSVAGCASLLGLRRPRFAALAALGAFLDPHVGLALGLGLFVCVRKARAVLIAGVTALLALGLLVSGPAREWEYVHSVLPAHALANLSDSYQFSATNLAFVAGASPALALGIGTAWYLGALALGAIVARRLRTRLGDAAVAYIPAAFVVFGGTHTHLQQLALAIPAFMLLSSAATGLRRDVCSIVTFVAAIPWLCVAPFPWLFAGLSVLAVVFARELKTTRHELRLAAGAFLMLVVIMLSILRWHLVRIPSHVTIAGNPLAEVSWRTFILATNVPSEPWYLVAKAPTMIAFLVLLGGLVNAALRPRASAAERRF